MIQYPEEKSNHNSRPLSFALKSLAIGYLATEALDQVSIFLYENESKETRDTENRIRGRQAYEKVVERIVKTLGYSLSDDQIRYWGWKFHRTFGYLGGFQYLALRRLYPKVGKAWGLFFGAAFFLMVDEFIIYLAKLTPGPRAFSWKVHARGAVSHVAWGVAAEATARALDEMAA